MKRNPTFHKKNPEYRVVSKPNGEWAAQRKVSGSRSKTIDDWQDLHKPSTYDRAYQIMVERGGLEE